MSRRPRIAVLGIKWLPATAGADRVVEQLLANLSPANDYVVYLLRGPTPPPVCTDNRRYVLLPALPGKHLRAPSYFLLCCLHLLRDARCDAVHVHNSDFGVFLPLLKLRRGRPIVGTLHGEPAARAKWGVAAKLFLRISEAVFVRCCDVVTSVSPEQTVRGRSVKCIPNGIEEVARSLKQPSVTAATLGLPESGFVMFACGRLDRTKGLHHLLASYRALPDATPLLVVGDFSHDIAYSREVRAAARQDPRVRLHPTLLEKDSLHSLLSSCRLFVFPSDVEGMSMMLLEAVAAGAAVLASDIPANLAVVGADYPCTFRAGDASSLLDAMRAVLADGNAAPDASELRARVTARLRWDRIARSYEQVYAHVLAGV